MGLRALRGAGLLQILAVNCSESYDFAAALVQKKSQVLYQDPYAVFLLHLTRSLFFQNSDGFFQYRS